MPQIITITDLRNINEISDACHAVKEYYAQGILLDVAATLVGDSIKSHCRL